MISEDIDQAIRDYYAWARKENPADLLWPHVEIVRRLLGGGIGCAGLSDDEAQLVNFALSMLKKDNPESYKIIKRVYADGKSIRWMESRGEGSRLTNGRLAAEGREFVKGVLYGSDFHAEKSGLSTANGLPS